MKRLPVMLAVLLLVGCAHYRPQPLESEKNVVEFDARRLDDAGLKAFVVTNTAGQWRDWPPAQWELNSLTLAAFYFHPDLAVARAEWRVAEAGIKTAGQRPNPAVSAGPGYNFTTAGTTPWMPFGAVDWPIETAGKRNRRMATAEQVSEAARWNYISQAWQIRSRVRTALIEYFGAEQRAALLQKQLETETEITRRLSLKFSAGAIARSALAPAEIALSQVRLDADGAQAKVNEARCRLAEAIGLPLPALGGINLKPGFPTGRFAQLDAVEARRAALLGRADIRAALADYAAAEESLRLEIARQYPDVHVNPNYQFDQGDSKWTLGITIELPVLNQNQGPIAEAKARRELAAAKFLRLQAQIIAEIDRAMAGWETARNQAGTSATLCHEAETRWQSVVAQVKTGTAEPLDQLNAEMELNSIRLAQFDTDVQWQTAVGALEDALQYPADQIAVLKYLPITNQP